MITGLIIVLFVTAFALPLKFDVPRRPVPVTINDVTATGFDMIAIVPEVK